MMIQVWNDDMFYTLPDLIKFVEWLDRLLSWRNNSQLATAELNNCHSCPNTQSKNTYR